MTDYDYTFKVMLIGHPSVPKSSLTIRYISGFFLEDLKLTIGVDFYSKTTELNGKKIKLQFWDFGGEERFRFLLSQYCKGANGAMFLYDITNPETLEILPEWLETLRKHAGNIPVMLVGMRLHLEHFRAISQDEGIFTAEIYNLSAFAEVSAKTGQNVERIFEEVAEILLSGYEDTKIIKTPQKKLPVEFKINEYLKLKLEYGKTYIYVGEKMIRQCKYLLFNIPIENVRDYDEIQSIDEAAEKLDTSMELNIFECEISPRTEFWGHCSNIQAWYDNHYDTRLLHRNLAFPLLKALVKAGDPLAKKVLKDEIALRIESGYPSVVLYLINEGHWKYLNDEELNTVIENPNFLKNLPNWFLEYHEGIPKPLSKKIKEILRSLQCPYCDLKVDEFKINEFLNGESIRCSYCYTSIIKTAKKK